MKNSVFIGPTEDEPTFVSEDEQRLTEAFCDAISSSNDLLFDKAHEKDMDMERMSSLSISILMSEAISVVQRIAMDMPEINQERTKERFIETCGNAYDKLWDARKDARARGQDA